MDSIEGFPNEHTAALFVDELRAEGLTAYILWVAEREWIVVVDREQEGRQAEVTHDGAVSWWKPVAPLGPKPPPPPDGASMAEKMAYHVDNGPWVPQVEPADPYPQLAQQLVEARARVSAGVYASDELDVDGDLPERD